MSTVQFNRDHLAEWYAKEHLKTDPGITKVIFLPSGAAAREIRFIEINAQINDDCLNRQLVPIDFGIDMGQESEHKLFVVDVTSDQWKQIRNKELALPAGWSLESRREWPDE